MSVHYIPPRDPNEVRVTQIQDAITEVLNSHISGRGKETKIKRATADIITALKPLLKLAPKASKGATVATEASSAGRKGPNNL
jgi:hypothetical protein